MGGVGGVREREEKILLGNPLQPCQDQLGLIAKHKEILLLNLTHTCDMLSGLQGGRGADSRGVGGKPLTKLTNTRRS